MKAKDKRARKVAPGHLISNCEKAVVKAQKRLSDFDKLFLNPKTTWEQCRAHISAYNKATEDLYIAKERLRHIKSTTNPYGREIEATDRILKRA